MGFWVGPITDLHGVSTLVIGQINIWTLEVHSKPMWDWMFMLYTIIFIEHYYSYASYVKFLFFPQITQALGKARCSARKRSWLTYQRLRDTRGCGTLLKIFGGIDWDMLNHVISL